MIQHIVLLSWKQALTDEQLLSIEQALAALPASIPQILSYQFGADMAWAKGNASYALIARFANKQDFDGYVRHPRHLAMMKTVFAPLLESYQAIQMNL